MISSLTSLFHIPSFGGILIGTSVLAATTISDSFLYLAMQKHFPLSDAAFPLLYIVVALVFMITAIPIGQLADRFGKGTIFLLGHSALLGVYIFMSLLPSSSLIVLGVLLAVMGLFYAATDGVLPALISHRIPTDKRASGLAIISTATGATKLVSSMLFGTLWSVLGIQSAIGVYASCMGLALIVGFVFYKKHIFARA